STRQSSRSSRRWPPMPSRSSSSAWLWLSSWGPSSSCSPCCSEPPTSPVRSGAPPRSAAPGENPRGPPHCLTALEGWPHDSARESTDDALPGDRRPHVARHRRLGDHEGRSGRGRRSLPRRNPCRPRRTPDQQPRPDEGGPAPDLHRRDDASADHPGHLRRLDFLLMPNGWRVSSVTREGVSPMDRSYRVKGPRAVRAFKCASAFLVPALLLVAVPLIREGFSWSNL